LTIFLFGSSSDVPAAACRAGLFTDNDATVADSRDATVADSRDYSVTDNENATAVGSRDGADTDSMDNRVTDSKNATSADLSHAVTNVRTRSKGFSVRTLNLSCYSLSIFPSHKTAKCWALWYKFLLLFI
jgi:hypothetical protein